jgi:hypothetical protein
MKRSRDQLKAELLAQAEEVIDGLLDWHEETEAPTLDEIEDVILELRKQMSKGMANAVLEEQEARQPVPGPECPECGREMHYKGMKETKIEGRSGQIELLRAYFYCDRCRSGLFPPR